MTITFKQFRLKLLKDQNIDIDKIDYIPTTNVYDYSHLADLEF